ncbi:MAG: endonuclease/exonuclease/phosphatase family protein [Microgenomates group bacterium]
MKLISVNIEGRRHLERLTDFFSKNDADVVCFQEIFKMDLEYISQMLGGMQNEFAPITTFTKENRFTDQLYGEQGIACFSKHPMQVKIHTYLEQSEPGIPEFITPLSPLRKLLVAQFKIDEVVYPVATTHFVWTPNGKDNPEQWEALDSLKKVFVQYKELIFCGDLNAPRGEKVFTAFSKLLTDYIPQEYVTSLDPDLHPIGKTAQLMVDGLFLSDGFIAKNVELHTGVSDHQAITAIIEKKS